MPSKPPWNWHEAGLLYRLVVDKRQDVAPFFDYHPDVFYPLLDDRPIFDVVAKLMGDDFILTVT